MSTKVKNILKATPESVVKAGKAIRAGKLVAFPTETVYGLGADATNGSAVAAIYAAKGRPRFNPLIVHVDDIETAKKYVQVDALAEKLAARFWPGALTLVMPRRRNCPVSLLTSAGLPCLAIRVPDNAVALTLLHLADRPIAAPSANRAGSVSPTTAQHVAESLGDAVDLILDGGPCELGVESTVLDLTRHEPTLLRAGGVTLEELLPVTGRILVTGEPGAAPASPGQQLSHYAPDIPLRMGANRVEKGEALLSFGRHSITGQAAERNLSERGNLKEAAANLFAMIRELDKRKYEGIAVMPIPDTGLGRAINDRLRRAAQRTTGPMNE